MSNATHFNKILGMYYMLKDGDVYMWHDNRWRLSAFKESDLNQLNGFEELWTRATRPFLINALHTNRNAYFAINTVSSASAKNYAKHVQK